MPIENTHTFINAETFDEDDNYSSANSIHYEVKRFKAQSNRY